MAGYEGFLNPPQAYDDMVSSIVAKDARYQYFEGRAFTTAFTRIENAIKGEARSQNRIWKQHEREYGKKDLIVKLQTKKAQYEHVEIYLWRTLVQALTQAQGVSNPSQLKGYPGDNYPVSSTSKDKVNFWDWLMFYQITSKANARGGFDSLDNSSKTYCILRSDEMYEYLRKTPQIATRLSRKDWEKGRGKKKSLYNLNDDEKMRRLENLMNKSLMKNSRSKDSLEALVAAAIEEMVGEKISDAMLSREISDRYIRIANQNLGEVKSKIKGGSGGYREMHDLLKKWLEDFGSTINNDFREEIRKDPKTKDTNFDDLEISMTIKNGDSAFFTLKMRGEIDEDNENLANDFVTSIFNFFRNPPNYITVNIAGQKKKFRLSKDARKSVASLSVKDVINSDIIGRYLNRNGKSLKSNSVIADVLGELGSHYHLNAFSIQATSLGSKQQMYNNSGNMVFVDDAKSGRSTYGKDYKSTGQSFSDMLFSVKTTGNGAPGVVQVGLNIKNYITDENRFTLTSMQTAGMNLTNPYLKRYLSQEEINLLQFVQSNNALLLKYAPNFRDFPDLEYMATTLMDNNIGKLLRIEGQGSDIKNYLIVANGHYIPASCIFTYALQKIKDNDNHTKDLFYNITNTGLFPFESRKENTTTMTVGSEQNPSSVKELDASTLQINRLTSKYQSLLYKIKQFEVNVSQLLT